MSEHSEDFIKGIEYAVDAISGSVDNPALNVIPARTALLIMISGLKQDVEDLQNVGG